MSEPNPGRADLARWKDGRTTSFYDATPNLGRVLRKHVGPERLAAMEPRLREFGATVATVVEPAVEMLERHRGLPAHGPYDGIGRRVEDIEFHPAYHDAGRAIWRSGIRALQRHGPDDLRERFLPPLLDTDYDRAHRASQFLTEVQGGSDVGANLADASPDEGGAWRITGEKWFCSVADADQFLVTARAGGGLPGTRGLGCFLVPRTLAGEPNGFRIRRLKDKLGTRAMASAEIELDGAEAYPIGAIGDGFHIAAGVVLNTSRWLNAVGSTGLMRRACLEATSYARTRRAFGRPIGDFALVREQLAVMTVEEQAALASTAEVAVLVDRIDLGAAGDDDVAVHRLLVNANKYATSVAATDVVHRAIEVLGGNGTIEDFSCLPRLYRDAIVFESWEGTHNVLCEQVRRDIARLGILDPLLHLLRSRLALLDGAEDARTAADALDRLEPALRAAAADPGGSLHFRRHLGRLTRAVQATCLLDEASADAAAGIATTKADVAAFFVRRHLVPGYDPAEDPSYLARIDAVLTEDPTPTSPTGPGGWTPSRTAPEDRA